MAKSSVYKKAKEKRAPTPELASVLEAPASQLVREEWLRRVEAEYQSAAITHHLVLWLIQIGSSPDLIRAGLRIVDDELVHSELSFEAYLAARGGGSPALPRETLQLGRDTKIPLEVDVTRCLVNTFCIGETVAVPLFTQLRAGCKVPAARRVLDRVLQDEVRHRDFGWTGLEYLLGLSIAPAVRTLVQRELPAFFGRVRLIYGEHAKEHDTIAPEDRAWGLMPPSEYAAVVERTLTRDWVPRFGALGIDAQAAWNSAVV